MANIPPRKTFYAIVLSASVMVMVAGNGLAPGPGRTLPDLETVLMTPIEIETISICVPAAKAGPFVNMECDIQAGCVYSASLRPILEHTRDPNCFDGFARLVAEYAADTSGCGLPLTVFNGWQWVCPFALGENVTALYDLAPRGGCWESSWEGQMDMTCSSAQLRWVSIAEDGALAESKKTNQRSDVKVTIFSAARTRDGYPKTRQL